MTHIDLLRVPDQVSVIGDEGQWALERQAGEGCWAGGGVEVVTRPGQGDLYVTLRAPSAAVKHVHLRWAAKVAPGLRFLGDHWERGYGDFEWRGLVPQRVMPWYFLAHDGQRTHGYGVKTGVGAICSWRVDRGGVSLWLDVRAGGAGVELGDRELTAATVVAREGQAGESAFAAMREFCARMCDGPRMPARPVYGGNNWYYAYGRSSHEQILADARLIASLAPDGANRPFMVIDDGWQVAYDDGRYDGGPWDRGNERFPDMPGLAAAMKDLGVRPGIWFRPLWTKQEVFDSWLLPSDRFGRTGSPPPLDPSVPDVQDFVATDVRRLVGWGYELIKHDFSTFEICGRWGFQMGEVMTPDGWCFADRSRTTAEVMGDLYRAIRRGAGDALVLGCNTVGHLAAGQVELQRTGDDTSGVAWERTRRMGVNTLAFRAAQHGTFFAADADCVGLTDKVPWELNRRWLELLARSGTPLFVSAAPEAVGPAQAEALKAAFAAAAQARPVAEPLDWLETTCPSRWRIDGREAHFDWTDAGGLPLQMP